jgi:hypothetical protein
LEDCFTTVEKVGTAGELAEILDERTDDEC